MTQMDIRAEAGRPTPAQLRANELVPDNYRFEPTSGTSKLTRLNLRPLRIVEHAIHPGITLDDYNPQTAMAREMTTGDDSYTLSDVEQAIGHISPATADGSTGLIFAAHHLAAIYGTPLPDTMRKTVNSLRESLSHVEQESQTNQMIELPGLVLNRLISLTGMRDTISSDLPYEDQKEEFMQRIEKTAHVVEKAETVIRRRSTY